MVLQAEKTRPEPGPFDVRGRSWLGRVLGVSDKRLASRGECPIAAHRRGVASVKHADVCVAIETIVLDHMTTATTSRQATQLEVVAIDGDVVGIDDDGTAVGDGGGQNLF